MRLAAVVREGTGERLSLQLAEGVRAQLLGQGRVRRQVVPCDEVRDVVDHARALPLALRVSELQAMLHRLPDGLATGLGEGGGLLSGGEGQRVRFARALQRREARLVILDEPFRALDRTQRRRLLQRARGYWSNATLFHVTHDLEETRSFDRVIVIEGGRIVEDGAPGELASRLDSRYSELLRAGEAVREELWGAAAWRRLWLEDGRFRRRAPRRRAVKERP